MRCARLSHAGSLDSSHPEVGTGAAGKSSAGEFVRIQLKVRRERILEAKFKAFGCSGSIASASLAAEWAEGKTLEEAASIRESELAAALELPPTRRHCSTLAEEALHCAIQNYREKCQQRENLSSIVSTGGSR
jgi:nitrogen fixation NifU-like protein